MEKTKNDSIPSFTKMILVLLGFVVILSALVFITIYVLPSTHIFTLEQSSQQN